MQIYTNPSHMPVNMSTIPVNQFSRVHAGDPTAFAQFCFLLLLLPISPIIALLLSVLFFIGYPSRRMAVYSSLIIGLSMAAMSYFIEYYYYVDMQRWMNECSYYLGKSLSSISSSLNPDHEDLLFWNLWCWIVGNTGDLALLQASAAFIGYSLLLWPFFDLYARRRLKIKGFLYVLLLASMMVPMQGIVGNVRSTIGCIVIGFAIYLRTLGGKLYIASYVLAFLTIFLHSSMLLAFVLMIVQPFVQKKAWSASLFIFISVAAITVLSNVILATGIIGDGILRKVLETASIYAEGTEFDQQYVTSFYSRIVAIINVLFYVLLTYKICKTKQVNSEYTTSIAAYAGLDFTMVNVGSRIKYIPLLVGLHTMLGAAFEDDGDSLTDLMLFVLAASQALLSFYSFMVTFNFDRVLLSGLFWIGSF